MEVIIYDNHHARGGVSRRRAHPVNSYTVMHFLPSGLNVIFNANNWSIYAQGICHNFEGFPAVSIKHAL